MNKVTLIGRLGQDPDLKYSQAGNPYCNFSLATSEKWKTKDGEQKESTEWHRCVAFGKASEIISQYVNKGDLFCVEGKIEYRQYEKEGETKYATQINVRNFEFVGGRKQETWENTGYQNTPTTPPVNDDDIPF